jgi:hypothetical protein
MTRTRRRFFRHGFLPQLMAFEAAVRLGSVTRAAEELALAQPTVSCCTKLSGFARGPVAVIRDRRGPSAGTQAPRSATCSAPVGAEEHSRPEPLPRALAQL